MTNGVTRAADLQRALTQWLDANIDPLRGMEGRFDGKRWFSSATVSTPAKPPPATTNVIRSRRAIGSGSRSACSNFPMTCAWRALASPRLFMVSA